MMGLGVGLGLGGGAQVHSSARHPEPEPINYLTCHLSAAIRAPLVDWHYVRLRLSDRLPHVLRADARLGPAAVCGCARYM